MSLSKKVSKKKTIALTAIATLISLSAANFQPRSAQAFVALGAGSTVVAIIGTGILLGGFALGGATHSSGIQFFSVFIGLLVLGEDGQSGVRFASMDESNAKKLEVSEQARLAYNENLGELNTIVESIEQELPSDSKDPAGFVLGRWKSYSASLDADAVRTAEKISAQLATASAQK